MEGQIMCVEQCTFYMSSVAFLCPQNAPKSSAAGALPQDPVGSLQRSPDPIAGFKGPTSKVRTFKRMAEGCQRGGEGRGAKMIYAPGQKPHTATEPIASN